ncbi:MAG: hypothetical protein AAGN46_01375 [Acidobacteriota bacterium]
MTSTATELALEGARRVVRGEEAHGSRLLAAAARAAASRDEKAEVLSQLAYAALVRGDLGRALDLASSADRLSESGDPAVRARVQARAAPILRDAGQCHLAYKGLLSALPLLEEPMLTAARRNLIVAAIEADVPLPELDAIEEEYGGRGGTWHLPWLRALIAEKQGDRNRASRLYEEASEESFAAGAAQSAVEAGLHAIRVGDLEPRKAVEILAGLWPAIGSLQCALFRGRLVAVYRAALARQSTRRLAVEALRASRKQLNSATGATPQGA